MIIFTLAMKIFNLYTDIMKHITNSKLLIQTKSNKELYKLIEYIKL